jgi:acetyl esterase/lipase
LPVITDVAYGNESRQRLDLYLSGRRPSPLFFFVHGGGWRSGDKSRYQPLGQVLSSFGYAAALPNHRLAPEALHPAHATDIAAALGFLQRRADDYGIRADGICLAGHSSGGHLVSLIALHPAYLADAGLARDQIGGVISISGVYDLTKYQSIGAEYLAAAFGREPDVFRDASPVAHISPGAPPFLLAYAEYDYPGASDQAQLVADALKRAGAKATVVRVPGRDHVSILTGVRSPLDPLALAIASFLRSIG